MVVKPLLKNCAGRLPLAGYATVPSRPVTVLVVRLAIPEAFPAEPCWLRNVRFSVRAFRAQPFTNEQQLIKHLEA